MWIASFEPFTNVAFVSVSFSHFWNWFFLWFIIDDWFDLRQWFIVFTWVTRFLLINGKIKCFKSNYFNKRVKCILLRLNYPMNRYHYRYPMNNCYRYHYHCHHYHWYSAIFVLLDNILAVFGPNHADRPTLCWVDSIWNDKIY